MVDKAKEIIIKKVGSLKESNNRFTLQRIDFIMGKLDNTYMYVCREAVHLLVTKVHNWSAKSYLEKKPFIKLRQCQSLHQSEPKTNI